MAGVSDNVSAVIREVGTAEVVSRFKALAAGEISEKSPGDFVTIADQECERVLGARLQQIRDIPVVGEESAAADASVLDLTGTADAVWVIDPVDGTANFVAGSTDYAVMVALVEHGEMSEGWVWHPAPDSMLHAVVGGGTNRNGSPVAAPAAKDRPTGIVKMRYMPESTKAQLRDWPEELGQLVPGMKCAGIEYDSLISGGIDFLAYWRTHPWDHAPCALIAAEAGLRVARFDGSPYRPGDGRFGLLAARVGEWHAIAARISAALEAG